MAEKNLVRLSVTASPEEVEILRRKSKEYGLPLSRYLVLKAIGKLARD